ncbi:MAG: DNA-processing protein DprA [Clostridia bacterium]|nr:DNA-processing protein DprA [Clostridia bacterium]
MPKYNTKELLLIWLDSFTELSYGEKVSLYEALEGTESIKRFLLDSGKTVSEKLKEKFAALSKGADNSYLQSVLNELDDMGITAVTMVSDRYPEELKLIETKPLILYCKGNIELLKNKKFAIVGSRKSLPLSIELAKRYAKAAADCGFTLVTGIADGVDSAVIESALLNKNDVISVFAGGLTDVYPKVNANLAEKLASSGLTVSEYPPSVSAQRFRFPLRNRIIAALSKGVLIVSGGEKSGTLYTGEYAMEFGKDVFAIPYSVGVPSGKTPNYFIKHGAYLTDDPQDIYDFYGVQTKTDEVALSGDEKQIILAIGEGINHVERIAERLSKQTYEIMPILSMLEIKGQIIQSGANKYSLIKTILEE